MVVAFAFGLIGVLLVAGYTGMKNGVDDFDPWDDGGI